MEDKFTQLWSSLSESDRLTPNDEFLIRVEDKAMKIMHPSAKISTRSIAGIAASILLLISINTYAMVSYNNFSNSSTSIESEYILHPNPLIQYK